MHEKYECRRVGPYLQATKRILFASLSTVSCKLGLKGYGSIPPAAADYNL